MKTNRTNWLLTIAATALALAFAQPSLAADTARAAGASVTRRVVVSIPDRTLALIENDQIVRIYPVAVGAAVSPTPVGPTARHLIHRIGEVAPDSKGPETPDDQGLFGGRMPDSV